MQVNYLALHDGTFHLIIRIVTVMKLMVACNSAMNCSESDLSHSYVKLDVCFSEHHRTVTVPYWNFYWTLNFVLSVRATRRRRRDAAFLTWIVIM